MRSKVANKLDVGILVQIRIGVELASYKGIQLFGILSVGESQPRNCCINSSGGRGRSRGKGTGVLSRYKCKVDFNFIFKIEPRKERKGGGIRILFEKSEDDRTVRGASLRTWIYEMGL